MKTPSERSMLIVTAVGEDGRPVLEERTIDGLLEVLCRRANRLVEDRETCERLGPAFREFVYNIVAYFDDRGELDEYTMTNIMTALATSDNHGPSYDGVEDYSTLIRRPNPKDPDTYSYFVIGREGRMSDPGCPLDELEKNSGWLAGVPPAQLHMFRAFHYARSKDATRGAPRIPMGHLKDLIPKEIKNDPVLEEAFLDVCFSDGAWELYQLKLAA